MKKVKKGSTIFCPLWDNIKNAKVTHVNRNTNEVFFAYNGCKYEYRASLTEVSIIKY